MSLDAIGVVVRNMKTALSFYQLFGLSFTAFGEDDHHYEATTSSGVRLMLDSEELIAKLHPDHRYSDGGRISLGFAQQSPAEVDALHAKIAAAGFATDREPFDAFWGQRYCTVKDPDGNIVALFAPLSEPLSEA